MALAPFPPFCYPGPLMNHVQLLSDNVINKIAAGEVVDRPASVLKELVENSLDSGATKITVQIEGGGKQLIGVADDGCGMSHDDALLAIERHATSKIRSVDDIEHIHTMGFRGEALAAIAAVSRFTLTTRPHDDLGGTEILINGGQIHDVRPSGCPAGTAITVRNLFFNVPARRKFLRSEAVELGHLRQFFFVYALAYPELAWRLVIDGKETAMLPATKQPLERIRSLFGKEQADLLLPIKTGSNLISVEGYTGLPASSRNDSTGQYIFINKRPITNPTINHAIREAYNSLLPKGRYPTVVLFLTMPTDDVDVNVHPTKKEVRLRQPDIVRTAISQALQQTLQNASLLALIPQETESQFTRPNPPISYIITGSKVPSNPGTEDNRSSAFVPHRPSFNNMAEQKVGPPSVGPTPRQPWTTYRFLGQIDNLYLLLETESGLVIVDPHAAHERVLYEKFRQAAEAKNIPSQALLMPENFTVPPTDALRVRQYLDLLHHLGFGVAEFGADTFIIDALPVCLEANTGAGLLLDIIAEAEGNSSGKWSEENIIRAACKAAVKHHDKLQPQEIEHLLNDLANTEMPYTCPHGRPTMIYMGFNELHRKFGRM